ncbi:MAG: MMPL family transporter [Pirellulaceae bacterium]
MAERNPLPETSSLAAPLEAVTRLVLRAPGMVLSGAVMLAVLSILVTVNGLSFKTSRLDLLNPRSEYNRRWLAYLAEFGSQDDAVIVVRSDKPAALTAAINDLAAELRGQPEVFESVFARRDLTALQAKALHYLPEAKLAEVERLVRQATAMVPRNGQSADPAAALGQLNERLEHVGPANPLMRAALEGEYAEIAGRTLAALNPLNAASPVDAPLPLADLQQGVARFDAQYLLADEGRIGFVLLRLKTDPAEFSRGENAIGQLRETISAAGKRHPDAWLGLTGMPVIEYDEMQASQFDMFSTSLISLAAVAALFVAGYGGLRHAILANIALLIAMAWSFGLITLTVGHLNILSSAFVCVLIGLGIDYGVYYVACYLRLRGEGWDEESALIETASDVGPAMVTGGVTTAAAFFMTAMTDFIGVRELGVVAGFGILLCVASAVLVLPPLVLVVDRQWPLARVPRILPAAGMLNALIARPKWVMLGTAAIALVVAAGIVNLRYDHNLLNLQPRHLESADIERELLTQLEDSVWFAVSICDSPADLHRRKAQFESLATVAKTEEIASLLPLASAAQQRLLASIHEQLRGLPMTPPQTGPISIPRLRHELQRAERVLAAQSPYETPAGSLVAQLRLALAQMPEAAAAQRLATGQAQLAAQAFAQLAALRTVADPAPPNLADLPPALADRFVGKNHKHLLKVYARGDIWDMENLERFVREVEAVDPSVTGHPVQTFYASRHMQSSYLWAGLYALVAVFVLLWFDFRNLAHSLLAMLPLAIGCVLMCGLIGWLDIPFNAANMIALPLILGIGVDNGVHLVHEWRRSRGRFRLSDSTVVALLLIGTTTTASFGSLILARHQGLRSLGQVLTLGVTTCLGASIISFPALLHWMTRHRAEVEPAHVHKRPPLAAEPRRRRQRSSRVPLLASGMRQLPDGFSTQKITTESSKSSAEKPVEPARIDPPHVETTIAPRRRPSAESQQEAESAADESEAQPASILRHLAGDGQSER